MKDDKKVSKFVIPLSGFFSDFTHIYLGFPHSISVEQNEYINPVSFGNTIP